MKLLHVVASYLPAVRYGGTIVSVHGLCKALAARGHDVHVFTTSVDGPRDSAVPHGEPVNVDGVSVWYFQSRVLRRLYRSPALGEALSAQAGGFDLIHTHAVFLWPLWAAAAAARRAHVPYVMSPRGMLELGLVKAKNPLLKRLWIATIEKNNLERAAAIHVTSRRESDELAKFGFALPPVHEVPNGVDLPAGAAPGAASPAIATIVTRGPFLLFLGRLNWKKGLDRLIAALPHAPGVRLVLAGDDENGYQRVLATEAAGLGVTDRITFAGGVFGSDKAALIAAADAVVLPSYSENFGNVVLEAMAAGRAVIVTPEVGLATVVERSGAGLVTDGAPGALAAALVKMTTDATLRRDMGERGRSAAAEFTWPAVAGQMDALYQSVLGKRARP